MHTIEYLTGHKRVNLLEGDIYVKDYNRAFKSYEIEPKTLIDKGGCVYEYSESSDGANITRIVKCVLPVAVSVSQHYELEWYLITRLNGIPIIYEDNADQFDGGVFGITQSNVLMMTDVKITDKNVLSSLTFSEIVTPLDNIFASECKTLLPQQMTVERHNGKVKIVPRLEEAA